MPSQSDTLGVETLELLSEYKDSSYVVTCRRRVFD